MSTISISTVNQALDRFFAQQRKYIRAGNSPVRRFTRTALAICIQQVTGQAVDTDEVSHALQRYRASQGKTTTTARYRLASRGYARSAQWYVMDGPGLDPLEGETLALAQVEWVTRDLGARAASDAMRELIPSAAGHPTIAGIVASTITAIEQALTQMVARARAEADFYEQVTGRLVEVSPPFTAAERLFIDSLTP